MGFLHAGLNLEFAWSQGRRSPMDCCYSDHGMQTFVTKLLSYSGSTALDAAASAVSTRVRIGWEDSVCTTCACFRDHASQQRRQAPVALSSAWRYTTVVPIPQRGSEKAVEQCLSASSENSPMVDRGLGSLGWSCLCCTVNRGSPVPG